MSIIHQTAQEEELRQLKRELERTRQERDILKNNCYLLAQPAVRSQVIENHRGAYPISVLCETLEVSESGYYQWCKRPLSKHKKERSSAFPALSVHAFE
jgi:hypothetical protein